MFVLDSKDMKKRYLAAISFFFVALSAPFVNAQFYDLNDRIAEFFGFGYYGDTSFALMKIALFIVLFALIMKSTDKLFPENKASSTIISLIISLMAIAFLPAGIIQGFGEASGMIGALILLAALMLIPWILLSVFHIEEFLGEKKWVLIAVLFYVEYWVLNELQKSASYDGGLIFNLLQSPGFNYVKWIVLFGGIIMTFLAFRKKNKPSSP